MLPGSDNVVRRRRDRGDRTRRVTGLLAVVLASGLTVAACGSGGASDAGPSGAARSVTDAAGKKVQVPEHPKRIVTLSEPTLDGALALKANVVGTTSGRGQGGAPAYLASKAENVPVVASVAGPNLEKIAAQKPDLILTDGSVRLDDGTRTKLDGIAPTVTVSERGRTWQDAFTSEARILNMSSQGKSVLAAYRSQVTKVKGELGKNANATVSIVRWNSGAPSVLLTEQPASQVVAAVGLRRPPFQNKRGPGHSVRVSEENLENIDADWMFFGTLGGAAGGQGDTSASRDKVGAKASAKLLATAKKTPGFTNLSAYKQDHIVPVDGTAWTSAGGPLAMTVVLNDVAKAMGS